METLLQCDQQPDPETPLRVMEGGRKLHEPEADPKKRQRKREPHGGQANGREHEVVVLTAVGSRDGRI
jgi:hypothetical protein